VFVLTDWIAPTKSVGRVNGTVMYVSEFAGSEMFANPTGSVATVIARADETKKTVLETAKKRTRIRFMTEKRRRFEE